MSEDYVASTIEITIKEFFEKYIDSKTVTFYKLEIYDNYSKERWILDKRYSEIDLLHKTLSKLYPNIPPMPGKTLFKIKNREALENRKKLLEVFLKECAKRKDIFCRSIIDPKSRSHIFCIYDTGIYGIFSQKCLQSVL